MESSGNIYERAEGNDCHCPYSHTSLRQHAGAVEAVHRLCGPIDEEIFTPELVREGSLCPHEDYIYFNWPSREELAEIEPTRRKRGKSGKSC